jgi:hypothetical protein
MSHRYGVPLSQQVSCADGETIRFPRDDQHLIAFTPDPTADEYVNWLTEISDNVVVMVIDEAKSTLIDDNTWMSTRLSGFIQEVLLSKNRKRMEYSPPIVEIPDAGEMTINGCHVIAGNYPVIEPGKRYLLFLQEDDAASRIVVTVVAPIRISDDGQLNSSTTKWLQGGTLDMVRRRIRMTTR